MRLSFISGLLFFTFSVHLGAQDVPSSLTCVSNARAWRHYDFAERQWEGKESQPFGTASLGRKDPAFPLRDKVFSKLETQHPIIRSITPRQLESLETADEFTGTTVLRTPTEIFIMWSNGINKVWLAVVDFEHKKAIVTQAFKGITSVGGEVETLNCR